MVKKISVFIMILGLFFVGIPRPNVNAQEETYDEGYDDGWAAATDYYSGLLQQEYDKGWDNGENFGYFNGYDDGYYEGHVNGNEEGWQEGYYFGYNKGLNETDATGFVGLLSAVFGGLASLLAIELLPGIYIGAIIAVPLVFGIIFFILGKRKGD